MEIKGRECEEIKIGDFRYHFVKEYRGSDIMQIEAIAYSKGSGEGYNIGDIKKRKDEIFKTFCKKILNAQGEEIPVGAEHLENLNSSDYLEIDRILAEHINELSTGEKKT